MIFLLWRAVTQQRRAALQSDARTQAQKPVRKTLGQILAEQRETNRLL